jgi:fatty-acyl-CoA synthase
VSVMNDIVQRIFADFADREALVGPDGRWTYRDLGNRTNRTARALLESGLQKGDRIALYLRNCNAWMSTEMGCLAIGVGVVPANQRFNAQETLWVLDNCEAQAVIFSPNEAATIAEVREARPSLKFLCVDTRGEACPEWAFDLDAAIARANDQPVDMDVADDALARIMYTSATTGLPKGVVISHDHWRNNKLHLLINVFNTVDSSDAYLAATPLTHMAGGWAWTTLLKGGKSVILEKWDVDNFSQICEDEGVTLLMMAPTIFVGLLQHLEAHPDQLEQIRRLKFKKIMYGASPMPEAVSKKVEDLFGPIMNQFYGFTENIGNGLGMTVCGLPADWHDRKRTSCGRPQLNTSVRVVDDDGIDVPVGTPGEVVTRMWRPGGIWKNEEATKELLRGGWVHSGDIGVFDADGFLSLVDRKNYMIISGGLNVYPMEIENVMYGFAGISECAVVGAPHEKWIETPVAFYTTEPGADVDPQALREYLRNQLAHYKVPSDYVEMAELPKSSYGKILKRELKTMYAQKEQAVS